MVSSASDQPEQAGEPTARERLLAAHGYEVRRRDDGWHECLLLRDGEAHLGRGRSADEALEAALARLLPGALPRALFDAELAREASAPHAEDNALAPHQPPAPPTVPLPTEALTVLDDIAAEMDAAEPEIWLDAPHAMRLQIATLIARARAEQEAHEHPAVEHRVKQIATRLSRWSRLTWSGDIRLLRLDTTPADAGRWLGEREFERWSEVAARSAEQLAALDLSDGGWSDGAACVPPPSHPTWSLDTARSLIERKLGRDAVPGDPATSEAAERWRDHEKSLEGFVRAARELRWLRPVTPDVAKWGAAMGLLRWVASRYHLPAGHPLVVALDPAYVPRPDWSHELGRDPRTMARQRRRRELERARPSRSTDRAAVQEWFRQAAEVFDASELPPLCTDVAALLLTLDPTTAFPSGPARDRLKKVQRRLDGAQAPARDLPLAARLVLPKVEEDPAEAEPPEQLEPTPIERARAHVEGLRTLVVGNREDPHLWRRYESDLGLRITAWCDASQGSRALDAAVERIVQGQYELVLCHTGFVAHATDGKVKRACRDAGVRYVPVYKGRVLRTALALLDQDEAAARAASS